MKTTLLWTTLLHLENTLIRLLWSNFSVAEIVSSWNPSYQFLYCWLQ